jgi:glutamyl/glutaminyl-tRNA synthetase
MHRGTAAAALLAWSHAEAHGGRFLLRWDDLDPLRCSDDWLDSLRSDLEWLGVRWSGEVRESDRRGLYEEMLLRLTGSDAVYPCSCSRAEIKRRTPDGRYDGHCRGRAFRTEGELKAHLHRCRGESPVDRPALRLRLDGPAPGFADAAAGPVPPTPTPDPVVWSREGYASYTFACAVDEPTMGITAVVRGRDLLAETPAQLAVMAALGLAAPGYLHFPLVTDAGGRKLSKSASAPRLRDEWSGDASAFRDWVGRTFFDPPVGGERLAEGWERSRLAGSG